VGPTFVEWFRRRWELPPQINVVDGATAGLDLLDLLGQADFVLVVDTVLGGGEPGSTYRFTPEQVPAGVRLRNSIHQIGFMEAWNLAALVGAVPEVVMIGVEPQDMITPHVGLTEIVAARLPALEALVLKELEQRGVRLRPR
jgi:hydrogenase maturation protease